MIARLPLILKFTMISTFACMNAVADDIDIYQAQIAQQNKPNILFVLDYSGSMANDLDGRNPRSTGNPSKISILKESINQILDTHVDSINVGIGSLYGKTTTGIQWPVSPLNADAHSLDPSIPENSFLVKDIIKKQLAAKAVGGPTATVDALVEASLYFKGRRVTHNDAPQYPSRRHKPDSWSVDEQRYVGGNDYAASSISYSPGDAYNRDKSNDNLYCNDYSLSNGPNYCEGKSITACGIRSSQDTATIGYERLDNLWGDYKRCEFVRSHAWESARYNSPINQSCQANAIILISDGAPTRINNGSSLKSIVGGDMYSCEDLSNRVFGAQSGKAVYGNCGIEVLRDLSSNNVIPGIADSKVRTYTIGLNTRGAASRYLSKLAEAGDGDFFPANSADQLSHAITQSISDIVGIEDSFAELSIDAGHGRLTPDNRAFSTLFKATTNQAWTGSLKEYFLTDSGATDSNEQPAHPSYSYGSDTSRNFDSVKADKNHSLNRRVSTHSTDNHRTLYTYTETNVPTGGVALSSSEHYRLSQKNSSLKNELFGTRISSADRNEMINWIQNAPMGDPLHSNSVVINYGTRQVLFITTNQGFLHAFDISNTDQSHLASPAESEEVFAFMPRRLLKNIPHLIARKNSGGHNYGLDGAMTRWHDDDNNDGIVNNNEKVLLVFGMRRGGSAYYAMDISQWNKPRLEWIIDNQHEDFKSLAQSWSRMSLISVNNNGKNEKVLAFAAGYDAEINDSASSPTPSSGNAIYMVNKNGQRIWKTDSENHPAMIYSIASDLTLIDSNGDKTADRLYVGDVGGQLWRVDFNNIGNSPTVTLLAELNDESHQPFFYPPSVALNHTTDEDFLSIAIGSGNRTNPLLTGVQNNLYMIRDTDIHRSANGIKFKSIRPDELHDVTDNDIDSDNPSVRKEATMNLKSARGWRLRLAKNEKSLSSLVSFEGRLLASTLSMNNTAGIQQCGANTQANYYSMNIVDARPLMTAATTDNSRSASSTDTRRHTLQSTGIPSAPVLIYPKESTTVQVMINRESVDSFKQKITRIYPQAR